MEKDIITLEDDKEYIIIEEIDNYLYLSELNNPDNICIRKKIVEDGKKYIDGLDDEEEVLKALKLFEEK